MGKLYTVLRGACRVVMPKMRAEWAVPFDGKPSVFCPNHAGAFGPIDMCAFFPLSDRCHPWLNAAVMDPKLVPAYVRQDYWWRPGCKLEPLYNATLPYLAAAVLPPLLAGMSLVCWALCWGWGVEAAPLPGYLIWAAIYCVLALVGVAIAGLFHFALKKEG